MSDTPLGRFCWYELMTSDPGAAPELYGAALGWTTASWDGGEQPYTMWVNGESPLGGVMPLPADMASMGVPPHWIAYVSTPDLAATTEKAVSLGAQVMFGPLTVPTVGTLTFLRDPQGAVFAGFQPEGDTPGHDGPAAVGEVSWLELATEGWKDAWDFYSAVFGWQATETMDMGEMGTYHMFGTGAHSIGGMFDRPPQMPVSAWCMYVRVADVDAAAARVKEKGGQILNGPMEVPGGDRVAQCLDAQGALFGLHQSMQG